MSREKKDTEPEPAFEESLGKLEEIVSRLETGDLSLEETIRLFEEGMALAAACTGSLKDAELKIRRLMEESPDN